MWSYGFKAFLSVLEKAVLALIEGRGMEHTVQVGEVKIFTILDCCGALVPHVNTTEH